ncbi:MAG: sigma 54-interacting transcriptional regulator, partial [Candidatus Rokubacteria bacterium]|nr:sigma 54-interacting transcriptional regulator [Candidatus Rokubacteria bacterium]
LNQHLDAILDASFDGFVVVDAAARVLKINKAYSRISGLREEDLVGQRMDDVVRRGVLSHSVSVEVIRHRISITMLHTYPTGNVALVTGTPVFDKGGNLALVIVNVRDITRLNQLRERLGEAPLLGEPNESIFLSPEYADLPTFNLVIHSEAMRRCFLSAIKVAKYDSPVLILGESGVGKGRFARLIHDASARHEGPFVHLNCGAIPEPLVESELFGYERGAFTGALPGGKPGQFELAQNGTIFLDEIAELSLNLQVKLLNVIEEKLVRRIGGRHAIAINARLIAATNRDLEAMVADGRFREDLYFRLNVVPLRIPPLRERPEEIPVMIGTFLEGLAKKHGFRKRLAPEVLPALTQYHYPGNVRELENILERLAILSEGEEIRAVHLKLCQFAGTRRDPPLDPRRYASLRAMLDAVEARCLREVLGAATTMREAATRLDISVPTLWRKLGRHGLRTQRPDRDGAVNESTSAPRPGPGRPRPAASAPRPAEPPGSR